MRCPRLFALLLALVFAGCGSDSSTTTDGAPSAKAVEWARQRLSGETFSFTFDLPDPDGNRVKLEDYQGKVLIVDFWGTWCPPCREEVPHFIKLHEKYKDQGLEIVGINHEQDGSPEEVRAAIRKGMQDLGVTYRCLVSDEKTESQVPDFESLPTTLFLDRSGKVRAKVVDAQPMGRLEAIVLELLNEKDGAL